MFNQKLKQEMEQLQIECDSARHLNDAIKQSVGYVELSIEGNLEYANDLFLSWFG